MVEKTINPKVSCPMRMSSLRYLLVTLLLLFISACESIPRNTQGEASELGSNSEVNAEVDVNIRWTSYGIPHVKADDWKSLGYGFAYATATDGICVIARDIVTVKGEQEKYFGKQLRPIDLFHRAVIDETLLDQYSQAQTPRALAFSTGYVEGYNRYLADHVGKLPASCKAEKWVRPIDINDMTRLLVGVGIRYGLGQYLKQIVSATPPIEGKTKTRLDVQSDVTTAKNAPLASNAIAFGRKVTANGRGILFGNPHYPWSGPSRFHLIHMTIPGELDIMGTSLLSTAGVSIGFNNDVAWSHTVSTGTRATLYELDLHPDEPTLYRFENGYREMEARTVELDTENGLESATVYFSHYGPIVVRDDLPWNNAKAYSVRDANLVNFQAAETYNDLSKATNVKEIVAALSLGGVSWVNTIAADSAGDALYADISTVPNVDAELFSSCQVGSAKVGRKNMVILNGSKRECAWRDSNDANVAGSMPAQLMPRLIREDYVTNSNDSYWLSNPESPLEGYSPIIGSEGTPRTFRTRAGLKFVDELLEAGPVKATDITSLISSHRNFAAEQLLDDMLQLCTPENTGIRPSCSVLSKWDRTHKTESRGAHLWTEIIRTLVTEKDIYRVPFDINDPANTPTGLNVADQETRATLIKAIINAQNVLAKAEIALDARLGDIQYAMRNGRKIAIPGGEGWSGAFSMIVTQLSGTPGVGYSPIIHGNSIIQFVSWNEQGKVVPRGILSYSQSQEPDSPHYSDQTELYSRGEWIDFPFYEADIVNDPNLRELRLTE
jgi:acyl-homoserine-lactone acylase